MPDTDVNIYPRDDGWAVMLPGAKTPAAVAPTHDEAFAIAKRLKGRDSDIVIQCPVLDVDAYDAKYEKLRAQQDKTD